LIFMRF